MAKSALLKISRISAWIVILLGVLNLFGWEFNLTILKSFSASIVTIKPNSAIEFILVGLFIIYYIYQNPNQLKSRQTKLFLLVILTIYLIIPILTMVEYIAEINLGIDQFLFTDTSPLTLYPGRMSYYAVLLFLTSGIALILISSNFRLKNKGIISGVLGLVIFSTGLYSLADYPWFGSQDLIGKFNPLSIYAAIGFIILGLSIFSLSLDKSKITWSLKRNITIGFVSGMFIMIGMDIFSNFSTIDLQESAQMVSHTHEVEYHIAQLSFLIQEIEINKQYYLLSANKKYRELTVSNLESVESEIDAFGKITIDNPNQQGRKKVLAELVDQRLDLLNRTFATYDSIRNGSKVNQMFLDERIELLTKIKSVLNEADNEEKKLLAIREIKSTATSKRTFFLVPLGSFASTAVLVWIFMLLNSEVSERLQSEAALKKSEDNLRLSNQELEQFAYVASHDLQEPLRMIASFTQLLEKRYNDKLDDDGREFIHYAVDGATRMQRLINDLLDYSRVTTRGKPLVDVDLSSVLGMAIANLQTKIQESSALIINDTLPFVKGDETQLMRVFQNLIDNAIKFRGKETPRINITSVIENNNVTISIQDNGIGIDLKYKDRIFLIFQRLHSSTVYPGTGIGLAVCKRTIERHGGNIWFESEPGKGTTFKFSLIKS